MIDFDMLFEVYIYKSLDIGEEWDFVFLDEFNEDGWIFYNGGLGDIIDEYY